MKLGIMQPYFFPYIGYFQLINSVDKWVVFDTPQYIRKGWVNRNRVLQKNGGVKYIGIPVQKSSRETPIKDIMIHSHTWREDIFNALDYYKQVRAPFYHQTMSFLEETFDKENNLLSPLLVHFLERCCSYLRIPFSYQVFSEMDMIIKAPNPGDWAFEISKTMNANIYINPPGGKSIFNKSKFEEAGIELQFLESSYFSYSQNNQGFEPWLSIIDVLMFNSLDQITEMLNRHKIVNT